MNYIWYMIELVDHRIVNIVINFTQKQLSNFDSNDNVGWYWIESKCLPEKESRRELTPESSRLSFPNLPLRNSMILNSVGYVT